MTLLKYITTFLLGVFLGVGLMTYNKYFNPEESFRVMQANDKLFSAQLETDRYKEYWSECQEEYLKMSKVAAEDMKRKQRGY